MRRRVPVRCFAAPTVAIVALESARSARTERSPAATTREETTMRSTFAPTPASPASSVATWRFYRQWPRAAERRPGAALRLSFSPRRATSTSYVHIWAYENAGGSPSGVAPVVGRPGNGWPTWRRAPSSGPWRRRRPADDAGRILHAQALTRDAAQRDQAGRAGRPDRRRRDGLRVLLAGMSAIWVETPLPCFSLLLQNAETLIFFTCKRPKAETM